MKGIQESRRNLESRDQRLLHRDSASLFSSIKVYSVYSTLARNNCDTLRSPFSNLDFHLNILFIRVNKSRKGNIIITIVSA